MRQQQEKNQISYHKGIYSQYIIFLVLMFLIVQEFKKKTTNRNVTSIFKIHRINKIVQKFKKQLIIDGAFTIRSCDWLWDSNTAELLRVEIVALNLQTKYFVT